MDSEPSKWRIIDLSATIAPSPPDTAPLQRVEIQYSGHAEGAADPAMFKVPARLLRDGRAGRSKKSRARYPQRHSRRCPLALQQSHRGKEAATIDELPLNWFFSDGVVLDMTVQGRRSRKSASPTFRPLSRKSGMRSRTRHRACANRPRRLLRSA